MAVAPTQTDYDLVQMNTRNTKIKVELLNFNFQTINSLEGKTTSGSIEIDANADIRRTCNLSLVAKDIEENMVVEGGELWLDKYIKIYQGIDNPTNNETVWWNMGIFLINNPNTVYSAADHTVTFEGLDLMAKLTGRRNGQLPAVATLVHAGSKIADVVKKTITQLGGFYKYIIEDIGLEVPYDIKMDMGATIYDLLAELRDLYSNWEMFFDVDGVFHWQKISNGAKEAVVVNFNEFKQNLVISDSVNVDFENVKNNIIVYGRLLDTGEQVTFTASDTNENSPFCIAKIGQINYIVDDERIYSNDLAKDRANYELYLHARLNDSISLDVVPIPWLNDVNLKISYINEKIGIEGEYLIQTLSIPLDTGSNMTITASKVYEEKEGLKTYISEYLYTGNNYSSTQTQFPYLY